MSFVLVGCSNSTSSNINKLPVSFNLIDSNIAPIPSVEMQAGGKTCITDDDGFCAIDLKTGEYEVTATKNGYMPHSEIINITDENDGWLFQIMLTSSEN